MPSSSDTPRHVELLPDKLRNHALSQTEIRSVAQSAQEATLPESNPVIGSAQRAMGHFLAAFFAALVDANILT